MSSLTSSLRFKSKLENGSSSNRMSGFEIIDLAKGWAIINDKEYVTHQDIKEILPFILRHRIKFLNQDDKFDFIKKEILEKIVIKK